MKKLNLSKKDEEKFVEWAKNATHGIDDSACMMGIWGRDNTAARLEFELQVGHCLCADKPLLLLVEAGAKMPERIKKAADAIEYYIPDNEESFKAALRRLYSSIGIETEH